MNEVTAVVLTIGEEHTERAIASVRRQTLPVADTIVVEGIVPTHRAINAGAVRVRTELFVQVDADMILNDTCVAELRRCMSAPVGLAIGHLQDPLLGRILGVKLFRTRCFERIQYRDSICASTNFANEIERAGWARIYALHYGGTDPAGWHIYGTHQPDYSPRYTFCKFLIEGARSRHRQAEGRLKAVFRRLRESTHSAAPIATIAMAHGLFLEAQQDLLAPYTRNPEFELLDRFLNAPEKGRDVPPAARGLMQGSLCDRFMRAYALGSALCEQGAPTTFPAILRQQQGGDAGSCAALIGLCHGLFHNGYSKTEAEGAYAILAQLLHAASPWE